MERPLYSDSGHLLFHRQGEYAGIWAVPFSLAQRAVTGEPFLVAADGNYYSLAQDGTLLYVHQAHSGRRRMVRVDREGQVLARVNEHVTPDAI